MPESYIQLPADSSGKKAHTFQRSIGVNSIEDEVVLLGEQYLASYMVVTASTSLATANSHFLQIMAGASLNVYVRRIEVYQIAAATAAVVSDVNLLRLSTAGTGGTVVTPNPLDTTDAASGATAMTLPTVKGTEGVALHAPDMYLIQTIGASTPFVQPIAVMNFDMFRTKGLRIPAGTANGICLKNTAAYAGATVRTISWITEANF